MLVRVRGAPPWLGAIVHSLEKLRGFAGTPGTDRLLVADQLVAVVAQNRSRLKGFKNEIPVKEDAAGSLFLP
jgi:hypothetical protein